MLSLVVLTEVELLDNNDFA